MQRPSHNSYSIYKTEHRVQGIIIIACTKENTEKNSIQLRKTDENTETFNIVIALTKKKKTWSFYLYNIT